MKEVSEICDDSQRAPSASGKEVKEVFLDSFRAPPMKRVSEICVDCMRAPSEMKFGTSVIGSKLSNN